MTRVVRVWPRSSLFFLSASVLGVALAVVASRVAAQGPPAPAPQDANHAQNTNAGIYGFTGHCASCHDTKKDGAEDRYTLVRHTPEEVLASITTGSMAKYATDLSDFEKRVIAVYVGGRPLGASSTGDISQMANKCESRPAFTPGSGSEWNGWGVDERNTRFQKNPGLSAADVPKLAVKWAFGFPNGNSAYGQPVVVGGRVFVSADTGFVYALDAKTGCVYWSYRAGSGVRTAINVGRGNAAHPYLAYFGDIRANVYAVDAETGAQVWMDHLDPHPVARITGAPVLVAGRLYVPLSSLEESGAGNPVYPCCTFRGGVAAYDAVTGKRLWKSYTIADAPKALKKTSKGTQLYAPAGAAVWSAPAVDLERKAVYVATGNGYTQPAAGGSDAIVAFDLETGRHLWTKQVMADDSYIRNCPGKYRPQVPTDNKSETCPDSLGPDMDFGNAPILRTTPEGRDLIVVGQKDADVWGLDPDKQGGIVWKRQIGMWPDLGGGAVMWGSAADEKLMYVPITRSSKPLGMAALGLGTGEIAWRATPADGGAAPVTVMPGVVFAGSSGGMLYAYSTTDGKSLWQFNSSQEFKTVNGVPARGGTLSAAGPIVADGMVFLASGYTELGAGTRGNVLLAFAPQ